MYGNDIANNFEPQRVVVHLDEVRKVATIGSKPIPFEKPEEFAAFYAIATNYYLGGIPPNSVESIIKQWRKAITKSKSKEPLKISARNEASLSPGEQEPESPYQERKRSKPTNNSIDEILDALRLRLRKVGVHPKELSIRRERIGNTPETDYVRLDYKYDVQRNFS